MLDQLLDMTSDGVLLLNASGNICHVGRAFKLNSGYNDNELKDKPLSFLQSAHHEKDFSATIWKDVLENGQWTGIYWLRRKSGESYACWLAIRRAGEDQQVIAVFSESSQQDPDADHTRFIASHYNALSGLPNRWFFEHQLDIALALSRRHITRVAVLYMNIDGMASINSLLSFNIGDQLLQQVAKRLENRMREIDIVGHMGQDEFAVILTEGRRMEDMIRIARTVHKWLQTPFSLIDNTVTISASTGIAIYPDDSQDLTELVNCARHAMKQGKKSGPGRLCFYNPETLS